MGTYLSTPVTTKRHETGSYYNTATSTKSSDAESNDAKGVESDATIGTNVLWGVVDMQGWRKTMEDSHVSQTNVNLLGHNSSNNPSNENTNNNKSGAKSKSILKSKLIRGSSNNSINSNKSSNATKSNHDDSDKQKQHDDDASKKQIINHQDSKTHHHVFGVFDGHGGAEVARFCSLYFCSMLTQCYTKTSTARTNTKTEEAEPANVADGKQSTSTEQQTVQEEAAVVDATIAIRNGEVLGTALIEAFHGLDKLIESRHDEVLALRGPNSSPDFSEQRQLDILLEPPAPITPFVTSSASGSTEKEDEAKPSEQKDKTEIVAESEEEDTKLPSTSGDTENSNAAAAPTTSSNDDVNPTNDTVSSNDDDDDDNDSTEPAGKQDASELDQDLSSSDEEENDGKDVDTKKHSELSSATAAAASPQPAADSKDTASPVVNASIAPPSTPTSTPIKINTLLKRLMHLKESAGTMVMNVAGSSGASSSSSSSAGTSNVSVASSSRQGQQQQGRPVGPTADGRDAAVPSIVRNGQLICNLPDHPIHAGATAIVAVIDTSTSTLVVANAGDSRAVLGRSSSTTTKKSTGTDTAYALSYDHKPTNDIEHTRIRNAGGFVNAFGRINGNLNLSRSIGDLKYKQVPNIIPSKQMITAQPDITITQLRDDDQFVLLGCDGIWDCLSNYQAVEFVRSRIHTKTPIEIGVEMLDTILSDEPRASQGIGGDNMTILIVDLQPHTRQYYSTTAATTATSSTTSNSSSSSKKKKKKGQPQGE